MSPRGASTRKVAESDVEELALLQLAQLGYECIHGPDIAPEEPAAERISFGDVVLRGRLEEAIALRHSPRVSRVVLVDATGIVVDGHPVADPFSMSLAELMTRSYYNPDAFRIDPSKLPEAARTAMAANRAALAVYGGNPSVGDPSLRGRLAQVNVPTLVLWGEADRIGDPEYGRAYAAAIPQARFQLLAKTGHVPQIESPEQVRLAIWDFAGGPAMAHAK
jgi:pimeloyl-ACP methyl ester carboxylesterase